MDYVSLFGKYEWVLKLRHTIQFLGACIFENWIGSDGEITRDYFSLTSLGVWRRRVIYNQLLSKQLQHQRDI